MKRCALIALGVVLALCATQGAKAQSVFSLLAENVSTAIGTFPFDGMLLTLYPGSAPTTATLYMMSESHIHWVRSPLNAGANRLPLKLVTAVPTSLSATLSGFLHSGTDLWLCDSNGYFTYVDTSAASPAEIRLSTVGGAPYACAADSRSGRAVIYFSSSKLCTFTASGLPKTAGSSISDSGANCGTISATVPGLTTNRMPKLTPGGKYMYFETIIFNVDNCVAGSAGCSVSSTYTIDSVDANGNVVAQQSSAMSLLLKWVGGASSLTLNSDIFSVSALGTGAIDTSPSTYYGTDYSPRIWRATMDNFAFNAISSVSWTVPNSADAYYDIAMLDTGVAVLGWYESSIRQLGLKTFRVFSCTSTDISTCLSDKSQCRWLLYEQRCVSMLQTETLCTSGTASHCIDSARTVASVVPSVGSTYGGTAVEIDVGELWTNDANIRCLFGTTNVSATYNTVTQKVECVSPATSTIGPVTVNVVYMGMLVVPSSTKTFTYYNCDGSNTCHLCTSHSTGSEYDSECAWCPLTRTCQSSMATCARGDSSFQSEQRCPQIVAITPSSGPMDTPTSTSIMCLNLVQGTNYSCKFGDTASVYQPGTPDFTSNIVTCSSPPIISANPSETVAVTLWVDGDTKQFVSTDTLMHSADFTYFSCSHYVDCGNCTLHSCAWCMDGATRDFSCISPSASCPQTTATKFATCPSKVAFTPSSVNLEDDNSGSDPTVSITVTLTDVVDGLEYFCPTSSINATAISASAKTVTCSVPRTSGEGGQAVRIYTRNSLGTKLLYVNAGNFYFFNCSAHSTDCATCVAQSSGLCGWCMATKEGLCTPLSRCTGTGCWANPTCPAVTELTPAFVNAEVPTVIVNGPAFPASSASVRRFTCKLSLSGAVIASVAGSDTGVGTMLNCSFGSLPTGTLAAFNTTPMATLSVAEDSPVDNAFGDTAAMGKDASMVNCTQDAVATTCSECVTARSSLCRWSRADGFCTTSNRARMAVAFGSTDKCPTLSIVDPATGTVKGGELVTIAGTEFINDTSLVLRLVGESDATLIITSTVRFVNSTRLIAEMPIATTAGRYSVSLYLTSTERNFATNPLVYYEYTKPQNLLWIIAVVGGAALLIIAIVVVIAVVVARKRRGLSDFKFDLSNEPDFSRYAYATDLCAPAAAAACKPNDKSWAPLRSALLEPQIAAAVAEVTQATEADRVANALVYIHAAAGRAAALVLQFVSDEVQSVPNENQLFRGNSMASKTFRAFSRMVGLRYLWLTLARLLNELEHLATVQDKKAQGSRGNVELEAAAPTTSSAASAAPISIMSTDIEIDPTKLQEGADEESQAYLLAQRSRALLLSVLGSIPAMPPSIRWIVHNIREQVSHRFPGSEHIAIGGTVFLRFICPAITVPHTYALLKSPPKDRLQRQLILLSKVLQNLANSVLFGKKEPFMNNMNEFIAKNIAPLHEWMDQLADADSSREDASVVPAHVVAGSLVFLRGHLETNLPKLRAALLARGVAPQVVQQLENAIAQAPAS